MLVNLIVCKIRKIPRLAENYDFLTLKFVLLNGREPNRKNPKMFAGKNLSMTQKIFTHWFSQKRPGVVC